MYCKNFSTRDYKRYFEALREHAMKIINFKQKRKKLLINEQQESFENAKL